MASDLSSACPPEQQASTFAVPPSGVASRSGYRSGSASRRAGSRRPERVQRLSDGATKAVAEPVDSDGSSPELGEPPEHSVKLPGAEHALRQCDRRLVEELQREYDELFNSIDAKIQSRVTKLRNRLEESRKHDLPPSYPPSEEALASTAGRSSGSLESVDTEAACDNVASQ